MECYGGRSRLILTFLLSCDYPWSHNNAARKPPGHRCLSLEGAAHGPTLQIQGYRHRAAVSSTFGSAHCLQKVAVVGNARNLCESPLVGEQEPHPGSTSLVQLGCSACGCKKGSRSMHRNLHEAARPVLLLVLDRLALHKLLRLGHALLPETFAPEPSTSSSARTSSA